MAPRDKRRNRSLWGAMIADPYRKLAAIGLAIALWFFLDRQVTDNDELELTLRAVNQSQTDYLLDADVREHLFVRMPLAQVTSLGFSNGATGVTIPTVTVTVRGPTRIVSEIKENKPSMKVSRFNDLEWTSIDSFTFDVDDISFLDRTLTDLKVTMDPERVRVRIEKNIDQEFPLKPEMVDIQFRKGSESFRDRLREKNWTFSREIAYVNGPQSKIEAFRKETKPFTVELSPTSGQREVSGTLTLNTNESTLHLRDPPTLRFPLRPDSEPYDIEVWINVDDVSLPEELQGRYVPETPSKTVKIQAGGAVRTGLLRFNDWTPEQVKRWSKRYLRLVVVIPELGDGEQPPPMYLEQAKLVLLDELENEDPVNCRLDQPETVTLVRREN